MRLALIGTLFLLGFLQCSGAAAEEIIVVVDLKFLKETDATASVLCLGESESDCVVWATHYLWEATVRKTIAGVESEKRFLVLFGRHALSTRNIRGMTAVLKRLEPGAPHGARYQVVAEGLPQKLVCFSYPLTVERVQSLSVPGEDSLSCLSTSGR